MTKLHKGIFCFLKVDTIFESCQGLNKCVQSSYVCQKRHLTQMGLTIATQGAKAGSQQKECEELRYL